MPTSSTIVGLFGGSTAASALTSLYDTYMAGADLSPAAHPELAHLKVVGDYVVIDAVAQSGNGADILSELEQIGLVGGTAFGAMASGFLPIAAIPNLDAVDGARSITPTLIQNDVGLVENQAVDVLEVDNVRNDLGLDGSGVTLGVLSNSFDALGQYVDDIASGDLPDDVNILLDDPSPFGTFPDEGRAMAQLIYDIAPGSDLAFHIAGPGQAGFAQGILDLRTAGSDIIVDDVIFLAEPMFSDGIIAQAVDAVAADGATYFASAGNRGRLSYEAEFSDSGILSTELRPDGEVAGILHDFDPDPDVVATEQLITVAPGASFTMILQWDDPFFSQTGLVGADTDIDVIVQEVGGTPFVFGTDNILTGDPIEGFTFTNDGTETAELMVQFALNEGPAPERLKYVLFDSGPIDIATFDTKSSTVYGHSPANGAIAVAASFFGFTPAANLFGLDPVPQLNEFSSAGPVTIFFDAQGNRLAEPEIREVPKFTAVDGVDTTVPGFGDPNPGIGFFGTSAAAPNAAAVAALLLEAFPDLTADEIEAVLSGTAIDILARQGSLFGNPEADTVLPVGFDDDSGAGLIQADAAIQALIDANPSDGEEIEGTDRADTLIGTVGDDEIEGEDGNDFVFGGLGDDEIEGGDGRDTLDGGPNNDHIEGDDGRDTLIGGSGNDMLDGGDGHDTLNGGTGNDMLYGDDGRDVLNGEEGDDKLHGGDSRDTLNGGNGDDMLYGDDGRDTLEGGRGDDTLRGGDRQDTLNGGEGNDVLDGEDGNDLLIGSAGADTMTGGDDRDTFFFTAIAGAATTITDFNPGRDRLTLDGVDILMAELVDANGDGRDDVLLTLDSDGQTITLLGIDEDDGIRINGTRTDVEDLLGLMA